MIGRTPKLSVAQQQEVVRLHRDEHVSTEELAKIYSVSQGTIWRILRKFGAVGRPMASKQEQKIIRKLSGKRTRKEIAEFLGKSLSCITFWQKQQGFRAHPKLNAELERHIIALYQTGLGQAPVGKETNTSEKVVHAVLLRHGIPLHKTSRPPMLTPEKRQQAVGMIRARNMYCKNIAKKLGVSRDCIEKLAREVLGCERFFGGPLWPPLQSSYPQRHQAWTPADLVRFLAAIFPDGVPAEEDYVVVPRVVSALLQTFPFWRTATTPELLGLESHLLTALSTLRAESDSAAVN